ncbi:hypothetical protein CBS101457_001622 [Exobasidium rhododendri]|nr:hypothetical protein CBS101457_001622 [Exobasidium rhododendri]
MTLVDALAGLQEGAFPTNEQTNTFLEQVLSSFPPTDKLSKQGEKIVSDFQSILVYLQKIVERRNGEEELQQFLWKVRGAAGQLRKDGLKFKWGKGANQKDAQKTEKAELEGNSTAKAKMSAVGNVIQRDTVTASKHVRTLFRLAIVQPELRHIVADLGYMFAGVIDEATGTSIEEARIQMGQVKSSTGSFQNVALKALNSARAQKLAANSFPSSNANGNVNQIGSKAKQTGNTDGTRLEALKEAAQGVASGMPAMSSLADQLSAAFAGGEISLDSLRKEVGDGRPVPALEELKRQAGLQAGRIAKGQDDLEQMRSEIASGRIPAKIIVALSGTEGEAPTRVEAPNGVIPSVNGSDALLSTSDLLDAAQMLAVANQKLSLMPADTISNVLRTTKETAKDSMREAWTKERRERLLARSKKLVVDCQGSKDYQEAFEWFIGRIERMAHLTQEKVALPSTSLDSALSSAFEPLIKLVENFAQGHSLQSILQTAKSLSVGVKDDETIASFWKDADHHLRRCLLEEGFILKKEAEEGMRDLIARFRGLQGEYQRNIVKLIKESVSFVDALSKDELLRGILASTRDLLTDLTFGKDGFHLPDLRLLQDVVEQVLPAFFAKFGVVPIPRIKYLHPDFDLIIENIAVELRYLLPDMFDFKMSNDVHFDFKKMKDSTHSHAFKLKFKGMSLRIHDLAFAITTRFGFKFHDHGIADLSIAQFGLSIYIEIPKDLSHHCFIVKRVNAKLGTLKLKVHESNHRVMHSIANGVANSYLTRRILRHFIGVGVKIGLQELDLKLMAIRLNKDVQKDKLTMEDMRRQMADLRDLLKKYHEHAGTIEIDFANDDGGSNLGGIGKSIEDSHAVRWMKKQVDGTGRKEIVRNEWRSNAFDVSGKDTILPLSSDKTKSDTLEASQKPEGPTNASTVKRASFELKKAEEEEGLEGA